MDTYYLLSWIIALLFFGVLIFKTAMTLKAYLDKQKELNHIDERYDDYKQHRSNLLV